MRAGNADLWSGLALAALGGYIIVQASGWEYLGSDGPGPGFFPLWYGIAMAALNSISLPDARSRSVRINDVCNGGRRCLLAA